MLRPLCGQAAASAEFWSRADKSRLVCRLLAAWTAFAERKASGRVVIHWVGTGTTVEGIRSVIQ